MTETETDFVWQEEHTDRTLPNLRLSCESQLGRVERAA